jgi:hypothetical protein
LYSTNQGSDFSLINDSANNQFIIQGTGGLSSPMIFSLYGIEAMKIFPGGNIDINKNVGIGVPAENGSHALTISGDLAFT